MLKEVNCVLDPKVKSSGLLTYHKDCEQWGITRGGGTAYFAPEVGGTLRSHYRVEAALEPYVFRVFAMYQFTNTPHRTLGRYATDSNATDGELDLVYEGGNAMYQLIVTATSMENAETMYRAIREGTLLPHTSYDREQTGTQAREQELENLVELYRKMLAHEGGSRRI